MLPKPKRLQDPELLESVREMPCCVCGRRPSDASHIRTRGSGGPDTPWNVAPHCRAHHTEWGVSWVAFIRKYPVMALWLRKNGWRWDDTQRPRLWHPGLAL